MKVEPITYTVSLHLSKFEGHWNVNKAKSVKHIVLFPSTIWKDLNVDFEDFDESYWFYRFKKALVEVVLIETVCIERANQGLRIKNKCKPCHVWPMVKKMLYES